jgi:hypothetical protein
MIRPHPPVAGMIADPNIFRWIGFADLALTVGGNRVSIRSDRPNNDSQVWMIIDSLENGCGGWRYSRQPGTSASPHLRATRAVSHYDCVSGTVIEPGWVGSIEFRILRSTQPEWRR